MCEYIILFLFLFNILISNIFVFFFFCAVAEVLTEEVILKWYKEGHSKGKTTFLEQMKKFIEWLQNAEEGKYLYNCIYNVIRILNMTAIFSYKCAKWKKKL